MRDMSNPKNWAYGIDKKYEGKIRNDFQNTVYFMVFDSVKPSKIGIREDKVAMKTAEWEAKKIGYKRIS